MPALDLALGLGMVRCATDMLHALVIEPFGPSRRRDSWIRCRTTAVAYGRPSPDSQPDALSASFSVSVTSSVRIVVQSFQAMI